MFCQKTKFKEKLIKAAKREFSEEVYFPLY